MTINNKRSKNNTVRAALLLSSLSLGFLAGCATLPEASPESLASWAGLNDCFDRGVTVTPARASAAATTCAGPEAAGNASETGVRRATAAFHAASAYNQLANEATPNAACSSAGDCHQRAASLISQSRNHQSDAQVTAALSDPSGEADVFFVLRRKVEDARAMEGLADAAYSGAICGEPSACLARAAADLEGLDFTTMLKDEESGQAALACDILELRAGVYARLGSALDPRALEDLRRLAAECPLQQPEAEAKLAEIAFERAERERLLVLAARPGSAGSTNIVQSGFDAVSNYRQAISAGRFELPSHRGIGSIYLALADLDPENARSHLRQAASAFDAASTLSGQTDQSSAAAMDLEKLGQSWIKRAELDPEATTSNRTDFENAARAFAGAMALVPSPVRHHHLAQAHLALGNLTAARQSYESAIPGLTGQDRLKARQSLASVLDRLGDPAGALQVLEAAAAQGPFSAPVNYEIGRRRFAAGDFGGAQTALRPAINVLTGQDKAEAGYMLSVSETVLRTAGWQDRAVSFADIATQAGTALWKYSRQACLATILKGGDGVKAGTNGEHCLDVATPEAQLLRGMYALKHAQLLDVSAYNMQSQARWRGVLREAEYAFQRGQQLLAASPSHERRSRFDDLATTVEMADALSRGMTVVSRCRRETTIEPGSQQWSDLEAFFGHYGVLRCSP